MDYQKPTIGTLNNTTGLQKAELWLYVETVAVVAIALLVVLSQIDVTP
jgi:hypothetical protein